MTFLHILQLDEVIKKPQLAASFIECFSRCFVFGDVMAHSLEEV